MAPLLGLAVIIADLGIEIGAIARANRSWLVHRLPDDAFYYLEVGQRWARGQGPTFDGIHRTNGFHPLWQLSIAAWGTVLHGDALIRAVLITAVVCVAFTMLFLNPMLREVFGEGGAVFGLVVAVHTPLTIAVLVDGMEGALVALALAVVAAALAAFIRRPTAQRAVLCGFASGFAVLARIDLATVVWLVPVAMVWTASGRRPASRPRRSARWRNDGFDSPVARSAGLWAAGIVSTAGFFFLWNIVTFGHLLTVSGTLKLHEMNGDMRTRFGGYATSGYLRYFWHLTVSYITAMIRTAGDTRISSSWPSVVLLLLGLGGVLVWRREHLNPRVRDAGRWTRQPAHIALFVVAVMLVVKALTDVVLLPYWAEAWYSGPERLAIAIALAALAWRFCIWLARRWRVAGTVVVITAAVFALPLGGGDAATSRSATAIAGYWQDANLSAASWIAAQGPKGRYGSPDSGLIGFYLDPQTSVVNLDGLINSYGYAAHVMRGDPPLSLYQSQGVRYLVARRLPGTPDAPSCATVLWSSVPVAYGGGADTPSVTRIPVTVFDLHPCLGSG